jgi:hypothetical protein
MMNLLISSLLSILAQNHSASTTPSPQLQVRYDGSISSSSLDLVDLEWKGGLPSAPGAHGDFLQITFEPQTKPVGLEQNLLFLYLQQQSRLAGNPIASDGDTIQWRCSNGQLLSVDLRFVRAIGPADFHQPITEVDRLSMLGEHGVADSIEGFFAGINEGKVAFETGGAVVDIPLDRVSSLLFVNETHQLKLAPTFVYFKDGSVLAAKISSCSESEIIVSVVSQELLSFKLDSVVKISRISFLGIEQTVSPTNFSIEGRDMRISGIYFVQGWPQLPKGVIELKCNNDGLLAIWGGIDDEVAAFAEPSPVRMAVYVNGKKRVETKVMKIGRPAELLRVNLQAGDNVELRSEALFDSAAGAHANWCQPIFI